MRSRWLFLAFLSAINLNALSFNGEVDVKTPLTIEFGLSENVSDKLVGTIDKKKIFECQPKLEGIIEYKKDSLVYYTNQLHQGVGYTCKMNGGSAEFEYGKFKLKEVFKASDSKYILKFNDEVNATELKKIKISDVNFSVDSMSKVDFALNLDKNLSAPTFEIPAGFESKFGAKFEENYSYTYSQKAKNDDNEQNFKKENEKAKTLFIENLEPVSLDGGKLAARIYLKDWMDDDRNLKKFIHIKGIQNFKMSDLNYIEYEQREKMQAEGKDLYYYIDIISDDFKPQTEYEITIKKGFGDSDNIVRNDSVYTVKMGNLAPFVEFTNDKPYISSVGQIGIKSANVSELKVTVEKLADQNYRYFLNFNSSSDDLSTFSKEVASKKYDLGGALNEVSLHKIRLDFAGGGDGVYKINLSYGKDQSISKVVYLSDIAISAKVSKNEIFVFANRLGENTMLANANVKIYSNGNDELAVGATNDEGVFKFKRKDIYKDVSSVVVSLGKEQNFLLINADENLNENARYMLKDANETIDAWTHFATDIIRPNEDIEGAIYLRDRDFKPLANMPVKLKITDPQSKDIAEFAAKTNEFGVISFSKNISSELSGRFMLSIIYANKVLAKEPFFVESFVPARLKNEIIMSSEILQANEFIPLEFSSSYLFGGAASGLEGSFEVSFFDSEYKSENYKDYKFKNSTIKSKGYASLERQIKLNEKGKASDILGLSLEGEGDGDVPSILKGVINFSVNDDGKNVSTSKTFKVYPYENMVGIFADKTFVEPNEKINIKTVALNAISGEPKNLSLKFSVKRSVWEYTSDNRGVVRWHKRLDDVDNFFKDSGSFDYSFAQSGSYTIVASDIVSGSSTSIDIDVSGWNYSTLMPTKELSKAQVKLNAQSYKKGDELSADISSAIKDGLALVTLEDGDVKAYKVVRIKNNSANAKFKLDFDFNGLYVGANIYRLADDGVTPFRTHGKTYAKADKPERKMALQIDAPKTVKTNQNVKISLKTLPNADISLFVVDLGVLNITSQAPANPLAFFNKILPDSVFDYDIYDKLTNYKVDGKVLSFGGDTKELAMEAKLAKHDSPVDSKNIKTFAKAARLKADANGMASYEFKTPNGFNSAIRVDAIVSNETQMDAKNSEILVKDDVIIKPSVLAYMLKGDELNASLRLINTTNQDKNLSVSIKSSPNLELSTDTKVNLKPLENKLLPLKIAAKEAGKANFEITLDNSGDTLTNYTNLDVVDPYPISTYAKSLVISKAKDIKLPKGFTNVSIDASNSVTSLLNAASQNLIEYPYGCAEQRSSRLLALLNAKVKEKFRDDDRKRFITLGLEDLVKMQKSNGSFGYWNELGYVNIFASVYATDVLLELDEAGYKVPKSIKDKAVKSLANLSYDTPFEVLYGLYVAARGNALDRAALNRIYDEKLYASSVLNKYLMASTLKIAGLDDEASNVLKNLNAKESKEKRIYSDFHSDLRDRAFVLYLHARHFAQNSYSDELANFLITNMDELSSTQERAFVLRALNAYFKPKANETNNKFKLSYDGVQKDFDGLLSVNITTEKGEFKIDPQGENKFFAGISSSAYVPLEVKHALEPKELDIYRIFVNKDGKELNLSNLKVNDVIYSKITLNSKSPIRNGVINEMISPCFEVVNENLSGFTRSEQTKNDIDLEYQSIKDDRVISFYNLESKKATLFTPYRVVMSGKCTLPAVITENMYNDTQNDYDLAQKSFTVK